MSSISYIILALAIGAISWALWQDVERRKMRRIAFERQIEEIVAKSLHDWQRSPKDSYGTYTYEGEWRDHHAQIRLIIDNLATRKLPVIWLSLSLFQTTKLKGTYDLMNRPAGVNSFSNFHQLPFHLKKPTGFEGQVELRSDWQNMPSDIVPSVQLYFMKEPKAKEFLATPKGVRMIWTLMEADRARYGIFREASFEALEIPQPFIEARFEDLQSVLEALEKGQNDDE